MQRCWNINKNLMRVLYHQVEQLGTFVGFLKGFDKTQN